MKIIVDQLETDCKNCIFRGFSFSIQGPVCNILNCKIIKNEEGIERPIDNIEKAHNFFMTFEEAMKKYANEEFEKDIKLTEIIKETSEKKINLVEDDGYLGKVKEPSTIKNSTEEERELKTIGEEIRSYKNKYITSIQEEMEND